MDEIFVKKEMLYINSLEAIEQELFSLNQELATLELTGSKEFSKKVSRKKELLAQERGLITDILTDEKMTDDIFEYFANSVKDMELDEEFIWVEKADMPKLISIRMMRLISDLVINKDKDSLMQMVNLCNSFDEDLVNTIFVILNQYLNNANFENIKKHLLTFKYNLAFIFPHIDSELLERDYDLNFPLYWQNGGIAQCLGLDDKLWQYKLIGLVQDILLNNIANILDQCYLNIGEENDLQLIVLAQVFIRSTLLFMDDGLIRELQEKLMIMMDIKEIIDEPVTGETKILEAFNKYKEDQELPFKISLKLKR